MRATAIVAACLLLTACSAPAVTTPAPTPTTKTTTAAATGVTAIDLGGAEPYGVAIKGDNVWAISSQAGTLSKIDPKTGKVAATVRLGGAASVLATVDALWVAGYGGPSGSAVYRIDPADGSTKATIHPGEVCCDLTEGDHGEVWVMDPSGGLSRIDPATNMVTKRLSVTVDRNAHSNVVYGGGSLWLASDTTKLFRINPVDGTTTAIDVGGGVPFVARDGLLWGASATQLWAVDEATGALARTVPLKNSSEVLSLELGLGAIWVGIRHPGRIGAVLRLDPSSGAVIDEIGDISVPARIGIGFGSAWITDSGSSSLFRVTPTS
jgi:streptogramin lyase